MTQIQTQTRGRLTLLLISAMFFAPILVAMYLYFSDNAWRPAESTQRGQLISPPVTLPDISLTPTDNAHQLREVWSLILFADAQCDAVCLAALENMRQIRLSLGPKMTRMQTVFIPANTAAAAINLAEFPKLIVSEAEPAADLQERIRQWSNGEIFLVDPLGNLMMAYPPGASMGDVRKDLGHLMKISGIG